MQLILYLFPSIHPFQLIIIFHGVSDFSNLIGVFFSFFRCVKIEISRLSMAIVIVIVNDDNEYDNLTGYMSINKQYLNVLSILFLWAKLYVPVNQDEWIKSWFLCQWPNFFSFILFWYCFISRLRYMTRTTQSDTITPLIVVILHQVFRGLAFISFHQENICNFC